jgi:hypothetical protein
VFLVWTAIGLAWYFVIKLTKPEVVRSAATWGDAADPAAEAEEAAHRVLPPAGVRRVVPPGRYAAGQRAIRRRFLPSRAGQPPAGELAEHATVRAESFECGQRAPGPRGDGTRGPLRAA